MRPSFGLTHWLEQVEDKAVYREDHCDTVATDHVEFAS